ncbi:MAG: sigma-70 family RNA polymerase sigma factor [Candidatus Aminicenantes bacterium]|nr:sigma-70 family RNA polymerase sigma factor [Candidatus Aminicenantes bacterium]
MDFKINALYSRYGPMVLRRCRQLLRDEDRALDAMQEVFTKLVVHKERLEMKYPSSLLYRISTNVCLNILRDNKSHQTISDEDILEKIAFYDENEDRAVVRDLLERIFKGEKKSTREIAVLHFVDGMTLPEVAQEVGLSHSGIRKRIRELQARAKIKKEKYYEN